MRILTISGHCAGRCACALVAAFVVALTTACGSGDDGASAGTADFRSVSLLAGAVDAGGWAHVDGPAAQARFESPSGVAVADDGAVWISEGERGRLRRLNAAGRVETVVANLGGVAIGQDAAGRPLALGRLGPMAAATDGAVYVAAEQVVRSAAAPDGSPTTVDERWVVLHVTRDGSVTPVMRSSRPGISRAALGLAVDRSGRLLVSDAGCTVWRATPGKGVAEPELLHRVSGTAEAPGCTMYDAVTSLTTDPQGRVVYYLWRGEVQRLEGDGAVTTLARRLTPAYDCSGMAYDRRGRLLLNNGAYQLSALDAQGLQPWAGLAGTQGWFDGPGAMARFYAPCGLALDAGGDAAFVVDQVGGTLRRIEADGRVSTVAGRALQAAFVDGDGMDARFGWYSILGSGWGGSVMVADVWQSAVREIDADGRVKTVVGQPGGPRSPRYLDGPVSQATLVFPSVAVVAGDGSLWIGDYQAVRRLGPDGVVRTIIALDAEARLLALDENRDILLWTSTLVPEESADPPIEGLWRFTVGAAPGAQPTPLPLRWPAGLPHAHVGPSGMCTGDDGVLYVSYGHALLRRAPDGQLSVWAGEVMESGAADGVAAAARFNSPRGLVCEGGGVYVADAENHAVRHVDAQRRVHTVLGRLGERGVPTGSVPGLLDRPNSLARVPGGMAVTTGLGVVIARH
jgi:hypothetical protein